VKKVGIIIGCYIFLAILIEGVILLDAITSKQWKAFIQASIIISLFSVVFSLGMVLIGKSEIIDCQIESGRVIKLFPMMGKIIVINKDDIVECNEYIHMFTVVLNINGKKRHVRLLKKYFSKNPFE
jgi:hypothetical protein